MTLPLLAGKTLIDVSLFLQLIVGLVSKKQFKSNYNVVKTTKYYILDDQLVISIAYGKLIKMSSIRYSVPLGILS